MKNFFKLVSLLMFSGVLFVACGSNNNNSSSSCASGQVLAANGQCGVVSAACGNQVQTASGCSAVGVTTATSGTCANPTYPYSIPSVNDPQLGNTQVPACCNTPSVTYQTLCVLQSATTGYGVNGGTCIMSNGQTGYYSNGICI